MKIESIEVKKANPLQNERVTINCTVLGEELNKILPHSL